MIRHGIFVEEMGTSLSAPITADASVQVVIGTAPVNLAPDPEAVVNVPILALKAEDAMEQLGYSTDMWKYTLCQTMYVTANVFPVQPVVYINVLDPSKHKKALTDTEAQVNNGQAIIEKEGILLKGLVVKKSGGSALTKDTDYTASFNASGHLVVTLIETEATRSVTAVTVSGNMIDPTMVTAQDVVGAYDVSTGAETGTQVIRQVYPALGVVPSLLLAPGWSQIPEVGIALQAKASLINGCFKALAFVDLDTETCKKYTDCKTAKEDAGFTSPFSVPLWPCDRFGDLIIAKSATAAAMAAYYTSEDGDVPSAYISNKAMHCTEQCLKDGTVVTMDRERAQVVNSYGVTTAINMNGFRMFGSYTGAFPISTDVKDIWFGVRRMFNWHSNSFILSFFSKVDDLMNQVLIESVIDAENQRASSYAPERWAGARMEYRADDNPAANILAGKMVFRQYIAPYTPAQEIVNRVEYDVSAITVALTGGVE